MMPEISIKSLKNYLKKINYAYRRNFYLLARTMSIL